MPQGSVLDAQEFIVYTEDPACLNDCHHLGHHLYVDDTHLIDGVLSYRIKRLITSRQTMVIEVGASIDRLPAAVLRGNTPMVCLQLNLV